MQNTSKLKIYSVLTAAIVISAGSIVRGQQIDSKRTASLAPTSTGTQNVKVVNTSAEPVPVTINGTPTVRIANTMENPMLIRAVDNPASQPFRAQLNVSFAAGDQGSEAQNSLAVPASKRLVIKYITLLVDIPPDQTLSGDLAIYTSTQSIPFSWFVLNRQANGNGLNAIYTSSQPVEIYLDPATEFWAEFFRNSGTGTGYGRVIVSGYLVNVL